MSFLFALLLMASLLLPQAGTGAAPPFSQFAAPRERVTRPAKVKLTDAKDRQYATRLREFGSRPPNFAGHFVLASWGCGASCVMGAAINAQTGEIVWLPFTVCCWDFDTSEPLEFRNDSRLLIVHGSRNEQGGGTYAYTFDGKAFTLLKADEKH